MSIRGLIILLLLLAALGLTWDQRARLQAWLAPLPAALDQKVSEARGGGGARSGALRKCVRGQEVSYTNVECPAGHQEQAVAAAPVNVLPATPVSKPAQSSSAPSSLHQALDLTRDDQLRDRIMERAINEAR